MATIQNTHNAPTLSPPLLLLMACGAGMSVASLYYNQPMLGIMGADLHLPDRAMGLVPTLTQLGYALGILFLAPLGDRYDRRTIILVKSALLALALGLGALAPGLAALLASSLAIGLTATLAQDIVPAAATLADNARRGRVVGTVMTGLLLGIILSRVVSGLIAQHWGWRATFACAAVMIVVFGLVAARGLPRFRPDSRLAYGALMGSLAGLWRRHPSLRRAALAQGLQSVGFSAFWSTLALMLHGAPFHLGSGVAGAFGLAGAVGALAAPLAGRLADKTGPERVARLGISLTALAFAAQFLLPLGSVPAQLALLAGVTLVFDLGVQVSLIAHQTQVYSLEPAARSRLNALLMVGMFIGMALGSTLGSWLLAAAGWTGVSALTTLAALGALAVRLWPSRSPAVTPCQEFKQI